jgi:putative ABC transport system permease protein
VAALTEVVDRVSHAPGVTDASLIYPALPLGGGNWMTDIMIPGKQAASDDNSINARIVTPGYYRALGIPLRRGRLFESADRMTTQMVAILNESAARKYFPGGDPIGRSVTISRDDRTIVGMSAMCTRPASKRRPARKHTSPWHRFRG